MDLFEKACLSEYMDVISEVRRTDRSLQTHLLVATARVTPRICDLYQTLGVLSTNNNQLSVLLFLYQKTTMAVSVRESMCRYSSGKLLQ